MPAINCLSCGCLTNSTLSNYWENPDKGATQCYARKANGKWERGCGYNQATIFEKSFADEMIVMSK